MTQQVLASRSGLNERYVSQIENGELNLTLDTVAAISKGLFVEVSDLMEGTDGDQASSDGDSSGSDGNPQGTNGTPPGADEKPSGTAGLKKAVVLIETYLEDKKKATPK